MNTSHQEVIGMQASPPIDKETLRAELKRELRSDFLQDIRIESGIDSSGEEAVWVWLVVDEGAMGSQKNKSKVKDIRESIYRTFSERAPGVFPYIRLENPKAQA
ncbi:MULTISPECIES: hypothetical protein [Chromohalobacter]|uniref:Uncharacterized protein n=2 Tax=Halomonadaceae TaxID=28256 RepID=A0ABV8XBA6_9GAMM|nr:MULTISPECIES: hypothetical protein [Chromohalobacter]MCK0752742.1 hypothetical protein [Chromohalobacter japonicus]MCK0767009.1 hypothetical protein [Chromohalobacter beijerinckii]MDF9435597.1 hypothetical protein [Chromohalobacter israelensis]